VTRAAPRPAKPRRREWLWLAAFAIPALLVVIGVQLYPLLYSAWLTTQDWSLLRSPTSLGSNGLANFDLALGDPVFERAVQNSLLISGVAVTIEVVLGILLAYLTAGSGWGTRIIRTILILPMVIAPVAAGTLWRMLLNTQSGLAALVYSVLGIQGPEWLSSPEFARLAVTLLDIWMWTPFVMLVVIAGIAAFTPEVVEAAAIDGASRWQSFRRVELPMLRPVLLVAVLFRLLDSLLSLDAVYSLTAGGPGYSTHTVTYYIYVLGLKNFDFGVAAAASWLFMAFAAAVILLMFWLQRRSQPA
jgi:multiple sugar transport system permease protein